MIRSNRRMCLLMLAAIVAPVGVAKAQVSQAFLAAVNARNTVEIVRLIRAADPVQRRAMALALLAEAKRLRARNLRMASLFAAIAYQSRALPPEDDGVALGLAFLSPDVLPIVAALFPGSPHSDDPLGFRGSIRLTGDLNRGDTARQNLASPN